jgi:hypothetical protein
MRVNRNGVLFYEHPNENEIQVSSNASIRPALPVQACSSGAKQRLKGMHRVRERFWDGEFSGWFADEGVASINI